MLNCGVLWQSQKYTDLSHQRTIPEIGRQRKVIDNRLFSICQDRFTLHLVVGSPVPFQVFDSFKRRFGVANVVVDECIRVENIKDFFCAVVDGDASTEKGVEDLLGNITPHVGVFHDKAETKGPELFVVCSPWCRSRSFSSPLERLHQLGIVGFSSAVTTLVCWWMYCCQSIKRFLSVVYAVTGNVN